MTFSLSSSAAANDTSKAGQLAGERQFFGEFSRYCVFPVHTRFDRVSWFVKDAERPAPDGRAEVIRQEDTLEAAVAGLI